MSNTTNLHKDKLKLSEGKTRFCSVSSFLQTLFTLWDNHCIKWLISTLDYLQKLFLCAKSNSITIISEDVSVKNVLKNSASYFQWWKFIILCAVKKKKKSIQYFAVLISFSFICIFRNWLILCSCEFSCPNTWSKSSS